MDVQARDRLLKMRMLLALGLGAAGLWLALGGQSPGSLIVLTWTASLGTFASSRTVRQLIVIVGAAGTTWIAFGVMMSLVGALIMLLLLNCAWFVSGGYTSRRGGHRARFAPRVADCDRGDRAFRVQGAAVFAAAFAIAAAAVAEVVDAPETARSIGDVAFTLSATAALIAYVTSSQSTSAAGAKPSPR